MLKYFECAVCSLNLNSTKNIRNSSVLVRVQDGVGQAETIPGRPATDFDKQNVERTPGEYCVMNILDFKIQALSKILGKVCNF